MTQESSETNRLLAEILSAIQGLDQTLKTHETRIEVLEAIKGPQVEPEELDPKDVHQSLLEQKVMPTCHKLPSYEHVLHSLPMAGNFVFTCSLGYRI